MSRRGQGGDALREPAADLLLHCAKPRLCGQPGGTCYGPGYEVFNPAKFVDDAGLQLWLGKADVQVQAAPLQGITQVAHGV